MSNSNITAAMLKSARDHAAGVTKAEGLAATFTANLAKAFELDGKDGVQKLVSEWIPVRRAKLSTEKKDDSSAYGLVSTLVKRATEDQWKVSCKKATFGQVQPHKAPAALTYNQRQYKRQMEAAKDAHEEGQAVDCFELATMACKFASTEKEFTEAAVYTEAHERAYREACKAVTEAAQKKAA